jgi:methyl-accepting chemotaxis protein
MRITIKLRIVATMAVAFFVAIAVGAFGLWTLNRTQGALDTVYRDQMMPIVQLSKVGNRIFLNRIALNRALLDGTPEAAAAASASITANQAEMDKQWAAYFPAGVSGDEEMSMDKDFIDKQLKSRDLITQEMQLLKSGEHEKAGAFMRKSMEPNLDEEASLIEKLSMTTYDKPSSRASSRWLADIRPLS